jgi:hypothetical protein
MRTRIETSSLELLLSLLLYMKTKCAQVSQVENIIKRAESHDENSRENIPAAATATAATAANRSLELRRSVIRRGRICLGSVNGVIRIAVRAEGEIRPQSQQVSAHQVDFGDSIIALARRVLAVVARGRSFTVTAQIGSQRRFILLRPVGLNSFA